ncbi:MAG: hypothetical protein IT536_05835 [Hyphomicrobiales bacterium]|nr:hypothetical protein [Hyphomicrobiales bacterium]
MKTLEPSDPHELVGVRFPDGDPDLMAECLIEEYLLLGWSDQQLMSLFTRPCFVMTHRIYRDRGDRYVAELIAHVRSKWTSEETDGCDA